MACICIMAADSEARRVGAALEADGHEVVFATGGSKWVEEVTVVAADAIILDIGSQAFDGYRALRHLREAGVDIPVLMLHAGGKEEDAVRALRLGADDYLAHAVGTSELLARVEALVRRWRRWPHSAPEAYQLEAARVEVTRFGDVEVSAAMRQVWLKGEPVELRPREFDLLLALLERGGRVVTRTELLQQVWGYDPAVTSRTVDIHVAELRRKLEAAPAVPRHIITVRKRGYRFQR
jgi:DNA-binding response OmpR family regulator